ncbi:hypothetical protein PHYBOEH_005822 [Phytophthora boehmeriae]|uniref:Uncharacterized protein n=1 Tax=Phytophthora boehmeriae TaxID=109152 RepID=A0A8T1X2X8_9STRA|nr:hypothetical protein PHYBOEH_005822 [Phytophthora boehmeriae]
MARCDPIAPIQEPSPESLLKKLLLDFRVTASEGELPRDVGELLVYARDRREDIESKLYELVLILNERELDLSEADVTTQRGEIRVQQEKMEDLMDEMAAQAQARDTASTEHEQIVARRAIRDATSKFTTAQGEASTAQANLNAGKRFLVSLRKAVARDKRVEAQRKEASEATTRSVNKQHRLARSTASWRSSES